MSAQVGYRTQPTVSGKRIKTKKRKDGERWRPETVKITSVSTSAPSRHNYRMCFAFASFDSDMNNKQWGNRSAACDAVEQKLIFVSTESHVSKAHISQKAAGIVAGEAGCTENWILFPIGWSKFCLVCSLIAFDSCGFNHQCVGSLRNEQAKNVLHCLAPKVVWSSLSSVLPCSVLQEVLNNGTPSRGSETQLQETLHAHTPAHDSVCVCTYTHLRLIDRERETPIVVVTGPSRSVCGPGSVITNTSNGWSGSWG